MKPRHQSPRGVRRRGHPGLVLAAALVVMPGCDVLPQTTVEWTVALIIAGVLVVGVGVMAWFTSRQPKK